MYILTPAQKAYVQNKRAEAQKIVDETQKTLTEFLNYVVQEAKLPPVEGGYKLNSDCTKLLAGGEEDDSSIL